MKVGRIGAWLWGHRRSILVGTLLLALILGGIGALRSGAGYELRVSFVYPGAENGLYPDGRRLLRDDLIDAKLVEQALDAMHERGWYKDIPIGKLQSNLRVQEHLSYPVQEKVQTFRAEGKEYSYYNNEYLISFTQPTVLHLKDPSNLFGLLRPDRSKEFVEALVCAYLRDFEAEHTEGNIYEDFSRYMYVENADFTDFVELYSQRATLCVNALRKKAAEDSTFVSSTTGLSFEDLIVSYESFNDVQLSRLRKYVTAEKLTRSLNDLVNKLEERRDNGFLVGRKKTDESTISKTAMEEYDHTFSENIIIVSVNEENGLYQARPKTAYDTVTQMALNASVAASEAINGANNNQRLIREYNASMAASGVQAKLDAAEEMVVGIASEYERLSALSAATIAEYNARANDGYIKTMEAENDSGVMSLVISAVKVLVVSLALSILLSLLGYLKAQRRERGNEVQ